MEVLAQRVKIKFMMRFFVLFFSIALLASCRSTRKIQTAITKKDTTINTVKIPHKNNKQNDTITFINRTLDKIDSNRINYQTFVAKVNVDYKSADGKNYNVNVNLRMYNDSAIWINVNALLGIDVMRVLITKDSLQLLDKLNRVYTKRSIAYLQQVTSLPLDLKTLQALIIGNPVFLDPNIISYTTTEDQISLLSVGEFFKNLLTFDKEYLTLLHSKLDDIDIARNRTADLTYSDYENKKGPFFSKKRRIVVAEKTRLDVKLDFRQYDFNHEVSFPFPIPKNYDRD